MIDFAAIRATVDLVALVESHGVELRRSGFQFVGLCPFHGPERTPSFYVARERGFYCHGCAAKGDAVDFVRMIDGVTLEEAVATLAGDGARWERRPRRAASPPREAPVRDAAALWTRLALRDAEAERYLEGRRILPSPIPSDVVRFNVPGCTGDAWLDEQARRGYRCAFAVRRPDGTVQTLSLRRVSEGEPKKLSLAGCPTKGAAICSPEVILLADAEAEFARDEVLLVEGGTDFLGASLFFAEAIANESIRPIWPLGVIGATNAASVVEAFAKVIRWRRLLLGFDQDAAGERAVVAAAEAARRIGARDVGRISPPAGAKDWAEAVERERAS